MEGRQHPTLRPQDGDPIPERKDAHARPTSNVVPHPRHRVRRLYDAQSPTTRATHPVYNDYELHLVDDDDLHHHNLDDNRSRTRGANVTPADRTPSAVTRGLPTGDRQSDREALVKIRPGGRPVGDRDRLARVELSTRRGEPDWVLFHLPDGVASARPYVRRSRLSRLVCGAFRCGGERCRGCVALRVFWFITLATLTWVVL